MGTNMVPMMSRQAVARKDEKGHGQHGIAADGGEEDLGNVAYREIHDVDHDGYGADAERHAQRCSQEEKDDNGQQGEVDESVHAVLLEHFNFENAHSQSF